MKICSGEDQDALSICDGGFYGSVRFEIRHLAPISDHQDAEADEN